MNSNLSTYFSRSKKNFILDIIDELKKDLQFKYNEYNDVSKSEEVDIHIEIDGTRFAILYKDWAREIGPGVIQTFDGFLTQQKSGTVGVVVTPDKGSFSSNCRKRSKTSIHHIILKKKVIFVVTLKSLVRIF
ncbi:hypothetical protein F8M41_008906 [Gigaspora margarita]|uniref:Restriction endonuclease type IV Mrr domain-containing protein n=1 Tax=Gigaspora margarita TaxID=4874 RepID=A0A8H3X2Z2_GIGMA|nr:hypothetical protein F8M41_008906 [Gigaspora margarita]